ncbi:MAG: translocation/assembly module TamB [Gemmatimonadetes bacterium]|nr:translocation/assembly module TamB [Gemmatimonadota bacterium]
MAEPKKRSRTARVTRHTVRTLFGVVLVVALGAVVLVETAMGHRTVLGLGLGQLESRIAGTVEVDAIRSASLLRGARLVGVRLSTPEGDPFLVADSLEASYALSGLMRGDLVFDGVRVWNPRVLLTRDSAGIDTFRQWLRGDEPPAEGGGGGVSLRLDGVRILAGSFALRLPAEARHVGGRLRVEQGEDERRWRAIDLDDLDAQLARVEISPDIGIEVDMGLASGTVDALERAFAIEGLRGDVRVLDGRVAVEVRSIQAPGIDASGTVDVDMGAEGGVETAISARVPDADLRPWNWLAEFLPPLTGSLSVDGGFGPEGQRWSMTDVDGRWSGGRVRGRGTVAVGDAVRFDDVDVVLDDLPVSALADYLPEPPAADGLLTGRVALSGETGALQLGGDLTLAVDSGGPVSTVFEGGLSTGGGGVGFDRFRATLDPIDYAVLGRFFPAVGLTGTGQATVDATGSLADGLAVNADVRHVAVGGEESQLKVQGNLLDAGEGQVRVDVQGDLAPLSLDALARDFEGLPLRGSVVGPWRARGLLRDLEIRADLITPEGRLEVSGTADVRDLGSRYALEAALVDFRASALTSALPDPSRFTGTLRVQGRGLDPATLQASASLDVPRGEVRGVGVDSLRAVGRVANGVLTLDTLAARVAGVALNGEGTLAADPARPAGTIRVAFESADLTGVRAIFRGDTVLTADDLTPLDRDVLEVQGVDPDTLPLAAEVVAEGRIRGEATLIGAVRDFAATGWIEGEAIRYGETRIGAARLEFVADGFPGLAGSMHAELAVDSAEVFDRTFTAGSFEVDYLQPEGSAVVRLTRDAAEDYRLAGRFELDSLGGAVDVDEATMRIDTLEYRTTHPTRIVWTDATLELDSLEIVGEGSDPVSIRASGVLPRRGSADFELDVRGLALDRLARVIQREDLGLGGTVDVSGRLGGTAAAPRFTGDIDAVGLEARNLSLDRVVGTVEYADLDLDVGLDAWSRDIPVFRVDGRWPFSWSLDGSRRDVSDREVALDLRADSLPVGLVLALLEDLEDTRGTVSGVLEVGGTTSALRPEGRLRLDDGAWTVGALGARQEAVQATFDVRPDRTVLVEATGRSGGTVDVTGTITLDSLASPALDLDVRLASFNAVNRRDIAGAVSGELELQGRYGQPRVLGSLQVDRGDLYLDEFARNVGVVDLTDPRFAPYFDQDLLASRPLLAETRNPFMDNLLVSIDLAVARNTWLRSTQLNVEMQGDLLVTYDRRSRDVVLIGQLAAVRGQYQFLGQSFEVEGGEVAFVGIAGINPNLSIQAAAQVRRRGADPLTIDAEVLGTLIEPRVTLSTSDAAVSESDILSYIAVGQPASSLTTQPGSALLGGGVSFIGGTLTSSLSSLAQRSGWIDFLAISQAVDATALGANAQGIGRSFADTQVELGRYFAGGDYFAALMFRPLSSAGGTGSLLGGARLEWQASEQYHLELFAEDRFLRTGSFGFRELGFETSLIYGFTLYREWGY